MSSRFSLSTLVLIAALACAVSALDRSHSDTMVAPASSPEALEAADLASPAPDTLDTAIFAGGSFWCLEQAFERLPGVDSATAGYTGGQGPNPNFESVSEGNSSYVQAVRVVFRPGRITYGKLVEAFWKNIDPTRADGQFTDEGAHFKTVIFYLDDSQKSAAEASRKRLDKSKRFTKPIVTEIVPATVFYAAEPEHQDYYKRSAPHYRAYLKMSGREAFLRKAWGSKASTR
jgi:peptide methionine sulfoxide reductase msrA/msrB